MSDLNSEPSEIQAIDQVIAESKAHIEGTPQVPVKKRKRGRPKKNKSTDTPQNEASEAAEQAAPAPDLTPFVAPMISLPFDYVADATGFDGFRVSVEEKNGLAPQVQAVLNQYLPSTMSSPHAPAYMLAGSITIMAITRFIAFKSWQREQIRMRKEQEKNKKAEQSENQNITPQQLYPVINK